MLEYAVPSSTVPLTAAVSARGVSNVWLHCGQQGSSTLAPEMRESCAASGCAIMYRQGTAVFYSRQ